MYTSYINYDYQIRSLSEHFKATGSPPPSHSSQSYEIQYARLNAGNPPVLLRTSVLETEPYL